MNRVRMLAVMLALLAPLPFGGALNALAAPAAQAGPSVTFQGSFPLTVEAGDYDLIYLVLDFAPGAGIPLHYHGGPALVVGMEGELTLHPEGGMEHAVTSGMVVNEKAGARHVMINVSSANAAIFAGVLLPKGAELTTLVAAAAPGGAASAQPAGMPRTGGSATADWLWLAVASGLLLLATGTATRLSYAARGRRSGS